MKYKLTIAYDGTAYGGWQVQNNSTAIQTLIEHALKTTLRQEIRIIGSGRTDAGVHALAQVAHFTYTAPFDLFRLRLSLNALLPEDIRICTIEPVPEDFHARFSARSKEYHYHLHLDRVLDPFKRRYSAHILHPVDLHLLEETSRAFVGKHDFTSFANTTEDGTAASDAVRTLFRLDVVPEPGGCRLEFEGDGFLYKMVRNITGTLLDVAAGNFQPDDIPKIFAAKDRRAAGRAAPPEGLFLIKVSY